jgi:hypothetical protein
MLSLGVTMVRQFFLFVIFLAVQISISGQTYDNIASRHFNAGKGNLNLTDSLGRKQGSWIHYTMFFNSWCSALSAANSDTCFRFKSSGAYLNDRKIGEWKYYEDGGDNIRTLRIEKYFADASFEEILFDYNTTTTKYNQDSSEVKSVTIFRNSTDTIITICQNRQCSTKYGNEVLKSFDFSVLENEIYFVHSGNYYRQLKKLKTK